MTVLPIVVSQNFPAASSLAVLAPHQHADIHPRLLANDDGDEYQPSWAFIYALDVRDAQSFLGHPASNLITDVVNKLMWGGEHQQICILDCFIEISDSNHIFQQIVSWKIFDVFVVVIYDFCQLPPSSQTHVLTVEANFCWFLTLVPIIFAMAEPQFPEPRMHTFKVEVAMTKPEEVQQTP